MASAIERSVFGQSGGAEFVVHLLAAAVRVDDARRPQHRQVARNDGHVGWAALGDAPHGARRLAGGELGEHRESTRVAQRLKQIQWQGFGQGRGAKSSLV